ncbi:MAG: glyoxalase [Pseudomonadota bacterium]
MDESQQLASGAMRPFVGSRDFELSSRFYEALGFELHDVAPRLRMAKKETIEFLLQDHYQKDWCDNSMIFVEVADATAWWTMIKGVVADPQFTDAKLQGPRDEPHGLVTYLSDPSGILWQFTQFQ